MNSALVIPLVMYAVVEQFTGFSGHEKPEKRFVLPIQAFIDEAGAENTNAVFVLVGFLNRAEQLIEFSKQWRRDLQQIAYYQIDEGGKTRCQR